MKTAVSLARLPTHRARQSGFHAQAHDSALPREPSGGYRGPEHQRDAGERTTCPGDLGCRLWDLSPLDAPLRRAEVFQHRSRIDLRRQSSGRAAAGRQALMNVARSRGTYCMKAAARCAPLAAAAGFAVAIPLPTPPCGTPPLPAYALLCAQPAMAILRPPVETASRSNLVLLGARQPLPPPALPDACAGAQPAADGAGPGKCVAGPCLPADTVSACCAPDITPRFYF